MSNPTRHDVNDLLNALWGIELESIKFSNIYIDERKLYQMTK